LKFPREKDARHQIEIFWTLTGAQGWGQAIFYIYRRNILSKKLVRSKKCGWPDFLWKNLPSFPPVQDELCIASEKRGW